VVGRNADKDLNGGVDLDFAYGGKMALTTPNDKMVLKWNGVTIDKVVYSIGNTFPKASGRSLSLDPGKLDATSNDDGANWCPTGDAYVLPMGDYGTPGVANPPCTATP